MLTFDEDTKRLYCESYPEKNLESYYVLCAIDTCRLNPVWTLYPHTRVLRETKERGLLHPRRVVASVIVPLLLVACYIKKAPNMTRNLLGGLDRLASKMSSAASSRGEQHQMVSAPSSDDMASRYFAIRVVDANTGRGVPLVFLRTTYKAIYMTDSAGFVAFDEPGLMTGEPLWVTVSSYGYQSPTGFLNCAGTAINPIAGGSTEIKLTRTQIAERLYRMTGYGIYRDSLLLGKPIPIDKPVLNAQVAGSDTIQCAVFQGKLFWMWQDTDRMSFPLGNFNMTGATTDVPAHLDPERGLSFKYYTVDDQPSQFVRPMVKLQLKKAGSFPIWVDGLTVVPDKTGKERLLGRYYAADHDMSCIEEGLVIWNESAQIFERLEIFQKKDALAPSGHAVYAYDGRTRYVYYGKNVRVKANFSDAADPLQYEAFTCLTSDGKKARRQANGALIWGWVKGGKPVHFDNADNLARTGILRPNESPYELVDVDTKQHIVAAQVGIAWNPYLGLWVNIIQQKMGDTTAGEIWFSTAQSPEGPWQHCRKVATHHMSRDSYACNHNDFYNPVQHYELMREGGRIIYFSGTLVNTFSGNQWWTPLYNYNNIMYRLDLKDSKLQLPRPPPALWPTKPDST